MFGATRISHHFRDCELHFHYFGLGFRFHTFHLSLPPCPLKPCLLSNGIATTSGGNRRKLLSSKCYSGTPSKSSGEIPLLFDCFSQQEDEREILSDGVSAVAGGVVALGKFDALHIGHRELAIQASRAGPPFLLSFVGMAKVLGWEHRTINRMFLRRIGAAFPSSKRIFSSSVIHDYASSIQELNKEMESVFGELPPDELPTSVSNSPASNEPRLSSRSIGETERSFELTHTGNSGEAQMVDVSPKESSKRTATAVCKVVLGKKVFDLVLANQMAKGDVLTVAKIAGITAAKQTSNLIPLCHNIGLSHVQVDLRLNQEDFSVTIEGEAASMGKTGVEMEAMTAVSIAGLTVYDMCKAASKGITITDIRLKHKSGGKSGDYSWAQ